MLGRSCGLVPAGPAWAQVTPESSHDPALDPPGFRWLCPREVARRQGLPEQVSLTGDPAVDWRMVGNALPPVVAGLLERNALSAILLMLLIGTKFCLLLPSLKELISVSPMD